MVASDPILSALEQSDLFGAVSPKELRRIRGLGKEIAFDAGEGLTTEGELGGRYFLILDGEVEVSIDGELKAKLGAGAGLGELSLLDGGPRSATATAVTLTRTFAIAGFNFVPLLRSHEVATAVVHLLCRRLREAQAIGGGPPK